SGRAVRSPGPMPSSRRGTATWPTGHASTTRSREFTENAGIFGNADFVATITQGASSTRRKEAPHEEAHAEEGSRSVRYPRRWQWLAVVPGAGALSARSRRP